MTKKSKKTSENEIDAHEDEYTIDHLADAIADVWEVADVYEDPFEVYVQQCRSKICNDRHSFRGRLRRGYRSLIIELGQENDSNNAPSSESI